MPGVCPREGLYSKPDSFSGYFAKTFADHCGVNACLRSGHAVFSWAEDRQMAPDLFLEIALHLPPS